MTWQYESTMRGPHLRVVLKSATLRPRFPRGALRRCSAWCPGFRHGCRSKLSVRYESKVSGKGSAGELPGSRTGQLVG